MPMHGYNQHNAHGYIPQWLPQHGGHEHEYFYHSSEVDGAQTLVSQRKTTDDVGNVLPSEAQHTQKRLSGQSDKLESKRDNVQDLNVPQQRMDKGQGLSDESGKQRDKMPVDKSINNADQKRKHDLQGSFHRHMSSMPSDQRYPGHMPFNYYTYHGEPSYNAMQIPPQWGHQFYRMTPNVYVPQRRAAEVPKEYYPVQGGNDQVVSNEMYMQRPQPYTPIVAPTGNATYAKVPSSHPLPAYLNYMRHMPHTPDMAAPFPFGTEMQDDWETMSTSSELSSTNRMPP